MVCYKRERDARRNIDIVLRGNELSSERGVVMAYTYHAYRYIFIGTPYLYDFDWTGTSYSDWYEDIDYLVFLLTHETIHIVLAEKIDCPRKAAKWGHEDRWITTRSWDNVSKKIGL